MSTITHRIIPPLRINAPEGANIILNEFQLLKSLGYSMIDEIKLENWKNENGDIVFKCKDNATKCV